MDKFEKKEITKKTDNFSRWYTDVILKAELADYAPVKGCMVIRPYGYALWERMQQALDEKIKKAGVENAYFPLFIPYSFLEKEKEHVEGFSPELAVVTIGGGEKLKEKLVVRPTSETVMYAMFAKWISSWRDLPLKINQWCNIVRWEKRTYLFLRTTEFLWQEGHTAHAIHKEARGEAERALKMYIEFFEEYLAMPGIAGKKSPYDKFPGAVDTFAFESLMPSGKALQSCTSHDLGQNFSKPFDIQFQDEKGNLKYVWQTSWGLTTRAIGGLIMVHGDNNGLVLPPKVAPIKVVIIPVLGKDNDKIINFCLRIKKEIESKKNSQFSGKVEILSDQERSFGWKAHEFELKGVPLAISIGPKEVEKKGVSVSYRVDRKELENEQYKIGELSNGVEKMLIELQKYLYNKARNFLNNNTQEAKDWQEFKEIMRTKKGFIKAFWCEDEECEKRIKKETKASSRCLPLDAKKTSGKCVHCRKPASYKWYFAQAY